MKSHPRQQVHQCERHSEGTKENVRYGEVGNEDVPRSQHHLVGEESQEDGGVTNDAKYYDQTIEDNQGIVHQRIQSREDKKFLTKKNELDYQLILIAQRSDEC